MRKLQDTIWEESQEADQVLVVVVVVVVIEANDICLDLPQEDTSHMEEEDMNMRIDITEEEEKAERDTMKEITIKNIYEETSKTE